MNIIHRGLIIILVLSELTCPAQEKPGAVIPWTTFEAESMNTTGTVMGPKYVPYQVETESSGQRCVKLGFKNQFVEFTSSVKANSMVIRYNLPDGKKGNGQHATLGIYKNGKPIQHCKISSYYSWLYGKYPFTNDPVAGNPRHFYDEIRMRDLQIGKGDHIRIQLDNLLDDNANYCIVDLVDLESIAPALKSPINALSINNKDFLGTHFDGDYTSAIKKCIAKAIETGKTVWIPAGTFKVSGDIILPENITVQGAGMWYSTLVGDDALYADAARRVRLKGNGSNIHISDFAIIGKLNYRSDHESNDGIVGSFGANSIISRIWIEHTKVGMWLENAKNLKITGCRIRNTMADGINFCVGMTQSTIEYCTARGTGDDCFAIWPAVMGKEQFSPGQNRITHCTAQLPYLANGAAIYGGESNKISGCLFTDISQGSAILISTTFPTESKSAGIDNNFSGTTIIENCDIKTSGGFDHEWDWRAALEICVDKRGISGIVINNLNIINSLSNAISVIGKYQDGKINMLANTNLRNINILKYGIAVKGCYGLFINSKAHGGLGLKRSNISEFKNESDSFNIAQ